MMSMDKQTAFDKDISLHWHCEVRDQHAIPDLRSALANERHPLNEKDFRKMLAEVIRSRRYSPQKYEELTGLDFDSVDDIADDLRELWRQLYGSEVGQP